LTHRYNHVVLRSRVRTSPPLIRLQELLPSPPPRLDCASCFSLLCFHLIFFALFTRVIAPALRTRPLLQNSSAPLFHTLTPKHTHESLTDPRILPFRAV
jgi:hypothetical protein